MLTASPLVSSEVASVKPVSLRRVWRIEPDDDQRRPGRPRVLRRHAEAGANERVHQQPHQPFVGVGRLLVPRVDGVPDQPDPLRGTSRNLSRLVPVGGPALVHPSLPRGPAEGYEVLGGEVRDVPLQTLPLWILGSDAHAQRATVLARSKGRKGFGIEFHAAIGALARRDFGRAARQLAGVQRYDSGNRTVLHYRIYALCMSGALDEARALARESQLGEHGEDERFARFLTRTFGIAPGA